MFVFGNDIYKDVVSVNYQLSYFDLQWVTLMAYGATMAVTPVQSDIRWTGRLSQ